MTATAEYNVDHAWRTKKYSSAEECLRSIVVDSLSEQREYHGAHEGWTSLKSLLDVKLEALKPTNPVEFETTLIEKFVTECSVHLDPGARKHVEIARLRWGTLRNSGSVFVGKHYGLPTRAIDWTSDALTGLFFACRRAPTKDGVLWWMSSSAFTEALTRQWSRVYCRTNNVEPDFERKFCVSEEHDALVRLSFPDWMARPVHQLAHVTISGRLGVHHDEAISALGVHQCGRIIIPAGFKRELINRLDQLGINGHTLAIGDSTIETIAADCAHAGQ